MKQCTIGIDFGKTNMRFAIAENDPILDGSAVASFLQTLQHKVEGKGVMPCKNW